MQVTPKKSTVISYLPQEIRETTYTDIIYRPVTREMLEQLFSNSAKKDKHKLVKKRRRSLIRQQVNVTSNAALLFVSTLYLLLGISYRIRIIFNR